MAPISNFIIVSLIVSLFYFIGFLTFLTDIDENKCEMTYMYEYPQFIKIKLPVDDEFPRYGLYAYGEGKLTEKARAMKFDGVPVLFIPGNAGSYKQVRSLASVALRKALSSRVGYHFDFFTVDLNDELSGLNGAVLDEQTSFVNHSLYRVLRLYDKVKSSVPRSVIVIGHSMGGVIAHNVMVNSENADNVDLLITLASPHLRPTVCLDSYMAHYYKQIESNSLLSNHFQDKTFITISGGNFDHLVNSLLTNSSYSTLNVATTAIPRVWLPMDHACITWCKQLILTIIRALFDSVDMKTKQLSSSHEYRLATFKHHLLKNSGTNIRWAERYKVMTQLDHQGEWIESLNRQYSVSLPRGTYHNQWHMVRIFDDPKHQALFVQAINLGVSDWIYACSAEYIRGQSRYCEEAIHLSHLSKIAPSVRQKRRTYYVDMFKLKRKYPKITHVVVRVPQTQDSVSVQFDIHNPQARSVTVNLPRWFSLSRTSVIPETYQESIRYEIILPSLQHVIQSYMLYIEPIKCSAITHHASATLVVPWANHDSHVYITESLKKPLHVRLHTSRPVHKSNSTAKVFLTLDPTCQYSITVRNSLVGMLGQFARFYSPLLVANMAAVILMSFRSQLVSLDENGYCTLFQSSLSMSTKPYYLITAAKLISRVLAWSRLSHFIPMPDTQILVDENLDFLILPLLLYVTSVGLTYLMSLGLWAGIILSESTVHKFVTRFLTRTLGGAVKWSDWLLKAFHRVPCVVAATLLCLGMSTCGALALCLGVAYYFLKLTQLCQDYMEGLMYSYLKKIVFKITRKFFKKSVKNTENQNTNTALEVINDKNQSESGANVVDNSNSTIENVQAAVVEQIKNKGEGDYINDTIAEVKDKAVVKDKTQKDNEKIEDIKDPKEQQCEENDIEVEKDNKINNIRLRKMKSNALTSIEKEGKVENETTNKTKLEQKTDEASTSKKSESTETPTNNNSSNTQTSARESKDSSANSEIHFHFTLFLMWVIVAALNIPSVLTWAHNFQYSNVLRPDPSSLSGIVLCACAVPLWQMELPKNNKKFYKHIGVFVYCMALLCLMYAPIHLYRLSYILTATISVVILHQLLAPSLPEDIEEEEDEPDPVALINDIKTKLE